MRVRATRLNGIKLIPLFVCVELMRSKVFKVSCRSSTSKFKMWFICFLSEAIISNHNYACEIGVVCGRPVSPCAYLCVTFQLYRDRVRCFDACCKVPAAGSRANYYFHPVVTSVYYPRRDPEEEISKE